MIKSSQRMIGQQNNPAINEHFKLQIKTLQNAPRDPEKLEGLLKIKKRQKEEAVHIEDTQRLVTEIEMLKIVLYLMVKKKRKDSYYSSSYFPLTVDRERRIH
jgi:hypothetical protein